MVLGKILILSIFVNLSLCFDRLIIQAWTDPKTFTPADYFEVYSNNKDLPKYISCSADKFFGPFKSDTLIVQSNIEPDPHNQLFGEFIVVLFDVKSSTPLQKQNIRIFLDPEDAVITELKPLPGTISCATTTGTNIGYFVRFEMAHKEYGSFDGYELEIQVNVNGKAGTWGIRKFLMSGSFCHPSCEDCFDEVDVCSACGANMNLVNGQCVCKNGFQIFSLCPTRCFLKTTSFKGEDICYLEFTNYLKRSFISSKCDIKNYQGKQSLICDVTTTQGYPIQQACADDGIFNFCVYQKNVPPACFNSTSNGDVTVSTNNMQSTIVIPVDQLFNFAFNSTLYQPSTLISNFNFSMTYNHQKNSAVHPQIASFNHTWETVIMEKNGQSPVIFDLFKTEGSDSQFIPLVYVCTDATCLNERILKTFVDKEYIYFRVYSNYFIENAYIDVFELKMISTKEAKVWDLKKGMETIVRQDFDCIFKVQIDFSSPLRRNLLNQMDYDIQTDNARTFLKIGLVSKNGLSIGNTQNQDIQNETIQSTQRMLPIGDLWDPMDSDFGMNLV